MMKLMSISAAGILLMFTYFPVDANKAIAANGWAEGDESAVLLLAERDNRKDRRDERGRSDERQDRRDCRQDEGRFGDDKRECKQESRGEGDEAEAEDKEGAEG